MKSFDGVPMLDAEGYCPACREWLPLKGNNLPKHVCRDTDRMCKYAGESPSKVRCVIKNDEERAVVVKFFRSHEESDPCLNDPRAHRHSIVCHGGDICRKRMKRIYDAYIEYMERLLH